MCYVYKRYFSCFIIRRTKKHVRFSLPGFQEYGGGGGGGGGRCTDDKFPIMILCYVMNVI